MCGVLVGTCVWCVGRYMCVVCSMVGEIVTIRLDLGITVKVTSNKYSDK